MYIYSIFSRNVDTRSISPANQVADLPIHRLTPHCAKVMNNDDIFDGNPIYS